MVKNKKWPWMQKGALAQTREKYFFFVNWWNAAEVWPLVEDRCSSDKNVMIRPAKWIRLCFHNSATKKEGKRKPSFPKTFEAVFEIIVLEKKVLGAAAKEKGCTYSWRTYEKLENSSSRSSRRMLGTWLNKSESWKCRIGRSGEGNKNGKEENSCV